MKKQTIGLVLFWVAVAWSIGWGIMVSIPMGSKLATLSMEEINQTAWSITGSLMILWGILGVPLGAIIGGVGVMLYSGAKGLMVWVSGIGAFLILFAAMYSGIFGHISILFAIGGSSILLLFFGILFFWAKERVALKGIHGTAADLRLIGYVFILMAAWFVCGGLGQHFKKVFEGEQMSTPLHIMIFFVLGWLFLFLSHYKLRKLDGG